MQPYPEHCLICGREVTTGIDSHIRKTHEMSYEIYCKLFRDAEGSYSVFVIGKDRVVLTITRDLRIK